MVYLWHLVREYAGLFLRYAANVTLINSVIKSVLKSSDNKITALEFFKVIC